MTLSYQGHQVSNLGCYRLCHFGGIEPISTFIIKVQTKRKFYIKYSLIYHSLSTKLEGNI